MCLFAWTLSLHLILHRWDLVLRCLNDRMDYARRWASDVV